MLNSLTAFPRLFVEHSRPPQANPNQAIKLHYSVKPNKARSINKHTTTIATPKHDDDNICTSRPSDIQEVIVERHSAVEHFPHAVCDIFGDNSDITAMFLRENTLLSMFPHAGLVSGIIVDIMR
ncbi:hypothetical protein RRG08_043334 [Elysia crispata]|uniref:Uncharacterized protein n=1 Tax=Elysia crispata TaxID=231223 RepID=A0AAE1BAN5_9GAST|nr:hypothetical protein RRG08_043334 [Elysia crispata]